MPDRLRSVAECAPSYKASSWRVGCGAHAHCPTPTGPPGAQLPRGPGGQQATAHHRSLGGDAVCLYGLFGVELIAEETVQARPLSSWPRVGARPPSWSSHALSLTPGAFCCKVPWHCLGVHEKSTDPPQEDSVFLWGLRIELTALVTWNLMVSFWRVMSHGV